MRDNSQTLPQTSEKKILKFKNLIDTLDASQEQVKQKIQLKKLPGMQHREMGR